MDEVVLWVLVNLFRYGIPILLFVSFIGSLGIPFPVTLVIISAGAFTRAGLFDWRLSLLACVAGAVLADHSEYLMGRWAGKQLRNRWSNKSLWKQAQEIIDRQGAWAILLTRFWLMPLAPAINFIAGSRYPYIRFLFFDLTGQLLWVLLYGGLGYVFADQLKMVSQLVIDFSGLSMVLVALAGAVYFLLKRKQAQSLRE